MVTNFTQAQFNSAHFLRADDIDFKVRGSWNTEKYCWPPWLADKKNFRILDAVEWLKQWYFDLGDSLLIVSALKPFLLFCLCLPFSFLPRKKVGEPWPPWCRQSWSKEQSMKSCRCKYNAKYTSIFKLFFVDVMN